MDWNSLVSQAKAQLAERSEDGPQPEYRPELGPCRLWSGKLRKDGYAPFYWMGSPITAHRAAWIVANDRPAPDRTPVDHLCRVRHCVRPEHLELVSTQENALRSPLMMPAHGAGASRRTHCRRGHELSGDNIYEHQGRRKCRTCSNERSRQWRKDNPTYARDWKRAKRANKAGE